MKIKLFFVTALLTASGILTAQTAKEEIARKPEISAANHLVYQLPKKQLTPAPQDEKPFYISHYGRHGSRYMCNEKDYTNILLPLREAEKQGKLTPLGKDVLGRMELIYSEAKNRAGELTKIGAEQHRGIAHRMFERFPEVFQGNVTVDAKSSDVIRCILSMENELLELARLNPDMQIKSDASQHDMYYIKNWNKEISKKANNEKTKAFMMKVETDNLKPQKMMEALFNDQEYVNQNINKLRFYKNMFELAGILQNSEIGKKITLFDLFTKDELYTLWKTYNMRWFIGYGVCDMNGGEQPKTQLNLLRKMTEEADSCIQLEHPGANLRFAHDTNVLPLVCLMNLNGYGKKMTPTSLEQNQWLDYRIFPMACNVQIVFYRKNPQDKDVLVKVLLNEEEATLPLESVTGPYYRWSDVRKYFQSL